MGLLIEGKWHDSWYDTESTGGRFVREASRFRHRVEADPGAPFPAQAGRYHLYVSLACPWANRALIFRALKGLERVVSVSVVDPVMGGKGWVFTDALPDHLHGARYLHQVYTRAARDYSGRVTVPVLWDKTRQTIVNNESAEIIRMFNGAFAGLSRGPNADYDYYPEPLREQIDQLNDWIYHRVNNGVYKAGFATTQSAYEEAYEELFDALDRLEQRLAGQRYLLGGRLTEADWRLFTTLVRFDPVYHGHFKCNRQRLRDFPNLWNYTCELYQVPGVAETVDLDHIKRHYYQSHGSINPTAIVPKGPRVDYGAAHDRERLPRSD